MNTRTVKAFWSLWLLAAVFSAPLQAQESGFPRSLPLEGGSITIYPMQVDALDGDILHFRAALAYRKDGDSDPVFGAGWFDSRVEIDRDQEIVHPLDLTVVNTRFPEGTDDVQPELAFLVAQHSPTWNLDFPLADLLGALETAELEAKTAQDINTTPPTILYRDHPALLVTIDGEPILRAIENSPYQAVINTPYPLIFDGRMYHLGAAKGVWYRAVNATGPYQFDAGPPPDIVAMVDDAEGDAGSGTDDVQQITAADAPEIIVATTPTELIVTDGPAAFVPLVDDLLVLNNSEDDVFMHISSQQYYVVLAGRWYHSSSLNGPWSYSTADALPAAFANIPKYSDQADSRVYVAGTDEAKEAVLDAQIPQPAAVTRGTVDLDVTYDGDPRFEPVEGTDDLTYAGNADATVLRENHEYYLVEDGVWYVSSSPDGPWVVSDYRPAEVASISPRSPVYNVKYVYIYDSTPEVVYVGYTPGYFGSYIYYDTIVYGTGWYYRPWVSPRYYYPRYHTWGFSVGYAPWYGWSFGLSWNWGPFYAGFYSGGFWHHDRPWYRPRHGYWGPVGYRPRHPGHHYYAHHSGGHDYNHYRRDAYAYDRGRYAGNDRRNYGGNVRERDRNGQVGRYQDRDAYGGVNNYVRNQNLYHDRAQRARISETRGYAKRAGERIQNLADNRISPTGRNREYDRRGHEAMSPPISGRSSVGPVRSSALRVKAQVRDASHKADLDRIVADNSGYARRKAQAAIEDNRWKTMPAVTARPDQTRSTSRFASRVSSITQPDRRSYRVQTPQSRSNVSASTEASRSAARAASRISNTKPAPTQRIIQRGSTISRSTLTGRPTQRTSQRTAVERFAPSRSASSRAAVQRSVTPSTSRSRYAAPSRVSQASVPQARGYTGSSSRKTEVSSGKSSRSAVRSSINRSSSRSAVESHGQNRPSSSSSSRSGRYSASRSRGRG